MRSFCIMHEARVSKEDMGSDPARWLGFFLVFAVCRNIFRLVAHADAHYA